jgi:hypothetical protein
MKACLLLQRRFAYVGHKLAIILKKKYGINEFCSYVSVFSSYEFLKNQKEIDYSSLLLDEEIQGRYKNELLDLDYLQNLEKEYGLPNLWPYIAVDRVIMFNMLVREYPYDKPKYNHEEMMRILQVMAKAIIKFFDEEKPDFLFMTSLGSIGTLLLYEIAKKKNVKVILCVETRIEDDYILTENYRNFSWVEDLITNYKKLNGVSPKIKEAQNYLESFRQGPSTSSYFLSSDDYKRATRKELDWFLPHNFIRSLSWFLKFTFQYFFKNKKASYSIEKPLSYLVDRIRRKTRSIIGFNDLYDEIDRQEDFAYFPLHLEPEISTMLFAPFWTNQINLIRQIARSLPLHFKLYVKEHPAMVGYRTRAYYKELKKIPNVRLIRPTMSSFELIKKSKLVTVITGTAGWQSVLFKKPVIIFGDVFYGALSMVKKCTNIVTLPMLVKEQLENFNHNERELENFIGAIMEESAPIRLLEVWKKGLNDKQDEIKRLELLADLIAKKLDITPTNLPSKI